MSLILDEEDSVSDWVRLHRNDLTILWNNAGRDYNPDLVAVENDGSHLLIEVKSDREIDSIDVTAKVKAARRWANDVNGFRPDSGAAEVSASLGDGHRPVQGLVGRAEEIEQGVGPPLP